MYPPLLYAPHAIGIGLASLLGAGPFDSLIIARATGLLAFLALGWWAIRRAPVFRYPLTLVGLLPTTLSQVAALSTDAVNLGLTFLFVSQVLRVAFAVDRPGAPSSA